MDVVHSWISSTEGLAQGAVEGVDRSVPLRGGHTPFISDEDLHRRLGALCAGVIRDDPVRVQLEVVLLPTGRIPEQELQGGVRHLEVIAGVLQPLQ